MSYQQVLIRRMLEGEPVAHIMEPAPITVPPETSVAELVDEYIYKYHHKMFPVARNGGLLGCVSTTEVKQVPREQWGTTLVGQIAEPCGRESTIAPDEDALRAFSRVGRDGTSRLFVVDHGKLLGIVTPRDLMKLLSYKLELEESEPGLVNVMH
jgi:CBS-domain-containing membrane protein